MAKRKKSTRSKTKRKARKRSGLRVVSYAGKKKSARRRSGYRDPFQTLGSGFLTSGIIRAASGFAGYIAKSNNMGNELPKVKILVPAAITAGAYMGVLPAPYLPAAIQATTDALVDNTEFLKDIFDFRFMDKLASKKGLRVKQIPQQFPELMARSGQVRQYDQGSPITAIMDSRMNGGYIR